MDRGSADQRDRRALVARVRRLVVKVGSGVLSRGQPALQRAAVEGIARDLMEVRRPGREVVLVSSGAIVAGMGELALGRRPTGMPLKQAAAAIGQSRLMRAYEEAFQPYGQRVAQILLTQEDLRHRGRYLNARNTLFTLLGLGVLPIVNENDTVAVQEIQFGDNDTLSALVAHLVDADLLVMLTDTEGLYTADPRRDTSARLVPAVAPAEREAERFAGGTGGRTGVGGMASKVQAARRAAAAGVPTVVASGLRPGMVPAILRGEAAGTVFLPSSSRMRSRKRWLAFAAQPRGTIVVDAGAREAVLRRGKSLLPSGVRMTLRTFKAGDVVSLLGPDQAEFARGLTNYSRDEVEKIKGLKSAAIEAILGDKPFEEVVHRDNLVLLEGAGG